MVIVGAVIVIMLAGAALLFWPWREEGEEFVLTLPADAPQASPGDKVRLRAVAEDGTALDGDFVVARASGAWVVVRHCRAR